MSKKILLVIVFAFCLSTPILYFTGCNLLGLDDVGGKDTLLHFGKDGEVRIELDYDGASLMLNNEKIENKIYYYNVVEPYLYVINKWGRYTVVDISKYELIEQTYKYDTISEEYGTAFESLNAFKDLRYRDNKPKKAAIEFGDGTLFLEHIAGPDNTNIFLLSTEKGENDFEELLILERYNFIKRKIIFCT